jgi:flagellar hook-basal body protein
MTFSLARSINASGEELFSIAATAGGKTYTAEILASQMTAAGSVMLKNGDSTTDTITMTYPSYTTVMTNANYGASANMGATSWAAQTNVTKDQLSNGEIFGGLTITGTQDSDYPIANMTLTVTGDKPNAQFTLTFTPNAGTAQTLNFTQSDLGKSQTVGTYTVKLPSLDDLLGASNDPGISFDQVTVAAADITSSEPSKNLGLSTKSFALTGGTEGGAVTLDQLSSINIGTDGTISVYHAEKGLVEVGRISLATFANPQGLSQEGTNYFSSTANSGEAVLADPGTNGTGALKSSSLEMSNVDLSSEFADMITTQRGFQANSRIITVSDTMLEELINLKR